MGINALHALKQINGKDDLLAAEKKPLTVRDVLLFSLLNAEKSAMAAGEEKVRRFVLSERVQAQDELDFSADEITLIKGAVVECYGPLVVGQIWRLLDPNDRALK